jgi:uncharacterized membrane protein HdeD (DUF308 family)
MASKSKQDLNVYWWALTVRGIAAILFGIAAVFWPGLTLVTLVYLISAFVLVSGIVNVIESVVSIGKHRSWALTLLLGLAQVAVGLYLVRHPQVTFSVFILVAGLLLIATGVVEVVAALARDTGTATSRMLTVLAGIATFVIGIILLFQPAASGVAFVWLLGLYALVTGPIMIALSLDVKRALEQ